MSPPKLNQNVDTKKEQTPKIVKAEPICEKQLNVEETTEPSSTSSTAAPNGGQTPEEEVAEQVETSSGEGVSTIQNSTSVTEENGQIEDKEPLEVNKPLPEVSKLDNPPNTVKDIEKLADEIIESMTSELTVDQKEENEDAQRKTEELQKEKDELRDILNKIK